MVKEDPPKLMRNAPIYNTPVYFSAPWKNRLYGLYANQFIRELQDQPDLSIDLSGLPYTHDSSRRSVFKMPVARIASAYGWLPLIYGGGKAISISRVIDDRIVEHHRVLAPENGYFLAAVAHENHLFAGGQLDSEVLGFFDLNDPQCSWQQMEVPQSMRASGKAIDDLLIDGNRIVAIDNLLIPKFLLVYDIANPSRPKFLKYETFAHGTYEQAIMGAAGSNWMAVLSSSMGEGGCFEHICIWRLSNLTKVGYFSQQTQTTLIGRKAVSDLDDRDFGAPWHQISFCRDVLMLASRKGLAVLDLTDLDAWLSAHPVKPSHERWNEIQGFVKSNILFHSDKSGATLPVPEAGVVVILEEPPRVCSINDLLLNDNSSATNSTPGSP